MHSFWKALNLIEQRCISVLSSFIQQMKNLLSLFFARFSYFVFAYLEKSINWKNMRKRNHLHNAEIKTEKVVTVQFCVLWEIWNDSNFLLLVSVEEEKTTKNNFQRIKLSIFLRIWDGETLVSSKMTFSKSKWWITLANVPMVFLHVASKSQGL